MRHVRDKQMNDAELKRLRKRVANQARLAGRSSERMAIVAWLLERAKATLIPARADALFVAIAEIEQGFHLKPPPGTEPKGDE